MTGQPSPPSSDARTVAPARALVIVPTYNESENISRLIETVLAQDDRLEILVVDDGSPDGTGEIVDRIITLNRRVHIHRRAKKLGLGTAYLAGFRWAIDRQYDLIMEMDADFSHDPAYLPQLIGAAEEFDLVIGSRYVPGGGVTDWGPLRRLISRGGSSYARIALGLPVKDLTGGFKCFRREVLEAINLDTIEARGYAFQVETTYRALKAGFRVLEMPIVFRDRTDGTSKMSRSIVAEAMWRVPAMRFRRW
jgi:dolichol-phosphate mannosyltransferase